MVLVSGRRALQLVTMLSPLLILVLSSFQPVKEKLLLRRSLGRCTVVLVLAVTLSVLLLGPIYSTSFPGIAERFSSGFDFGANSFDDSPDARYQQYFALVRGWLENPLIGSGLGASAYGSTRSDTMPWAYELYYFLMLFHTGLLGFMAYTAGIVWIYWTGMKIIKRGGITSQSLLPVLVGMSGLLIATVTNPYLARFDGIWVIFLPLAFINHWLLKRDRAHSNSFEGTLQFSEHF
jgi:O-antigen ligase